MKQLFFVLYFTFFICDLIAQTETNDTTLQSLITTTVIPAVTSIVTGAPVPALRAVVGTNEIKEYNAQVISTNFTIPIIRFNPIDEASTGAPTDRKGNVSFFNSIGAGVGYYWGRLTEVTDANAKVISTEMDNTFGIQTGFLFAANSSNGNNANIFAWTIGISLLNFQIGYGYEFGTVGTNEKRGFVTLAYGIPVSKLIRGGFFKVKKTILTDDQLKNGFVK
ncbi:MULTISPECIES: hypothetical protein [unclassified Arcicella]|uniref:hypothetical protein n=1 Tax=unclassified Arcicella TaxID=2644986 RepID=UPI002857E3FD|nr:MULTISPECIES: hypothetical protein [unclassified Arcicella]MDR6563558.1 hypothetical protein [Arcicella sp. BE51]MDR6813330.1 hypothetical protein [Arcicella sp. BE140]MDR6824644.1 hypothetical protein [Arcicella sp. BE139]